MCGILALLGSEPYRDEPALEAALRSMAHRGPDASGLYHSADGRVHLGHRRLAVMAPSDGAQPLTSEDGSIVAVVNGEFYGFAAIRRELEGQGHRFLTRSDSEVLVHLYEEQGTACLSRLRGEFAFVLWDARKGKLFAARDRFGIKPLVYAEREGQLLLASEAKALFALGLPAAWDKRALSHTFTHQYLPEGLSYFEGVHTLPPGTLLEARAGEPARLTRYWDLDFPTASRVVDEREAVARIRQQLEEAVKLRLCADTRVACHLSGGLDSAAILALAARESTEPVTAFTVAFAHPPYGEGALARGVADALGARLHSVEVTQDALLEALPDAVYFSEGLCINGQLPAKYLLARTVAAQGFKVALSGEGSDEAFLGYAHLALDATQAAAGLQADAAQVGVMLPRSDAPDWPELRARLGFVPAFLRAKFGFGQRLAQLMQREVSLEALHARATAGLLDSLDYAQLRGRPPVLQSAYLWTRLTLAGYILRTLGDGTEMAASVEGRTPFLDHVLFEAARDLPIELKLRGNVQKYVLREALRGLLPDASIERRKHPFLAPPLTQFRGPRARELVLDILHSTALDRLPLIDAEKARSFVTQALAGGHACNEDEPVLMLLLSACLLQGQYRLSEGMT